jgi:hypothetical protein
MNGASHEALLSEYHGYNLLWISPASPHGIPFRHGSPIFNVTPHDILEQNSLNHNFPVGLDPLKP